uniref:DNA-directed DNA polymerase n=1 Tax=viral metagenome TaxID=1070528 RepID=A0A6M3K9X3_9ZZZZ
MSKCTRCKWSQNSKGINCTGYFGLDDAEIVFVGEAFGATEAETGIAFSGDAGEKLDLLLELAGLKRSEIVIMNAMRCFQQGNPTPTERELDTCFPFVLKDLMVIKPKLIVALGRSAFYSLTGIKEGVTPYIGKLLKSDKIPFNVFVTFHPAATLYDSEKLPILEEHFKMIPFLINKEPEEIKHYEYIAIDTPEKFFEIQPQIERSEYLYLDTETTGLSPYVDDLRLIQIGLDDNTILVINSSILHPIKDTLKKYLESKKIVGAGYEFDHKFIKEKLDIDLENYSHDVILAEYLLTGMKDNDLTFLTGKYDKDRYGYDKEVIKAGGAHKIYNLEELKQYGANDVGVMYPIKKAQRKLLAQNNQLWLFENITMPSNKVLTKMSIRGVQYDLDQLWKVDKIYESRAKKLLFSIENESYIKETESYFKKKFNPRSYDMVKWLLLDYFKLPILKETKTNTPSIGKGEMKRYAEQFKNPYCLIMEKYRSLQNIRDNFLSGTLSKLHNGVAHTKYSLHSTATGRPNSIDPNLLNLPRAKEIKECIIARPGYQFVCADEAQLEVRISSVVYDEPKLIEICNDFSKDIHCAITAQAFDRDYDEIYNGYKNGDWEITELRVQGKAIQFGVIYQEGPQKLAYELGIQTEEAAKFIQDYYKRFSNLRKNIDAVIQFVIEHGYVDTYFNFRRRWKFHSEEDHSTQREAVNHGVQSLAFSIIQLALIEIDKKLEEVGLVSRLVLQVYDSVIVETLEKEIPVVAEIVKNAMENVIKPFENINRVKLKSDIEVGPNLADLETFKFS